MPLADKDRWLIAIDIDGTLVHDNGFLSHRVVSEVARIRSLGHEVVIATGRSASNAFPVVNQVGIESGHAVCSNGAVTIELGQHYERGFKTAEVITFEPKEILTELVRHLPEAHFAVEDVDGSYRFHRPFPEYALGELNFETPLEELMQHPVSRVVVLSPSHDVETFTDAIDKVGLQSVSYAIGYTAWLDIAPKGVTKATGLEKRRQALGVPENQLIVMGDGHNDIPMFEWAKELGGLAFAMGQAPEAVKAAATATTSSVEDDGVANVLADFEGILFSRR
jgi:Cof subfamily protein (haloacid dehalogenase superfamily)